MKTLLSTAHRAGCRAALGCVVVALGLQGCADDRSHDRTAASSQAELSNDAAPPGTTSRPALTPKVVDPSTSDKRPIGYANLLLADEFGGTALDRTKWCTRLSWGGSELTPPLQVPDVDCVGWDSGLLDHVNDEKHRFRDFDIHGEALHAVSNGILKLRATVKSSNPADMQFESAMIRGKQLLLPDANKSYYITGRYRLPSVLGALSQTWLAPSLEPSGIAQWPPEFDILEGPNNASDGPERLYQLSQVQGQQTNTGVRQMFSAAPNYNQQWGFITESASLRDRWVEVGAEWSSESVCFFIDGKRSVCDYYRWITNDGIQGNPATLLVNMAVGGSWAGRDGIDLTNFPTSMDVDYLHVYERTHRAMSGRGGNITAAATISGQQPQPTTFQNGAAYYAVGTRRLDGGAIQASTTGAWSLHSIDAGNPLNNPHLFTFEGLTGTTGYGVNFAGIQSTNASNTGTAAGNGYSVHVTRANTSAAWTASLVRNDGAGTAPVSLQTIASALPASTVDAAIRVNVVGTQVTAFVTGDTGAVVNLAATDSTHRGNWVGAEVFPFSGLGPLIVEAFGLDVLAPAVIPGPTPGQAPAVPEVTYPSADSTLFGTSQVAYWWGANVANWWVYAGSTPGARNYFDSGLLGPTIGTATGNVTMTGLPVDGSTVYLTLFYRSAGGAWQNVSNTYTAAGIAPAITSPAPASTLTGPSQPFAWSGSGVTSWWIYAGSAVGGAQYFNSGNLGTATGVDVTGLPVDGSTVYVRLWYQYSGGAWKSVDSTYTASTAAAPTITSPAPGATLTGANATFQWTGAGVAQWWLYAGSSAGANNYFDSGSLGTSGSATVTGLPTNGSTVHVRLWYRYPAGAWQNLDATYKASGTGPSITAPSAGATINGTSRTFQWTAPAGTVTEWWVYVGSTPGSNNYFDSHSLGSTTSVTVTALPANGSTVYTTLWYRSGTGPWQSIAQANVSGP